MEKKHFDQLRQIKQEDVKVLLKKSYRGIWETAIKKYSDSAHFIYELLQNADDTKATWVDFDLTEDGLWFIHNGKIRFTISDPENEEYDSENGTLGHINSITSIGNSTKIDEQKIGKFGIGFKAVFAYSDTPFIYDDNFNFKLENYIVPVPIDENISRKKGETIFFFPFNHKTKEAKIAYQEIEERLDSLFQPILFLSSLEKVSWKSLDKKGIYNKSAESEKKIGSITAILYNLISNDSESAQTEKVQIFTKEVVNPSNRKLFKISIGYFILEDKSLETGFSYDAFCYFPTKEDTKLGFMIQAPFLLTDSRESIQSNDEWNKILLDSLAELAASTLSILKDFGIADSSFLLDDSVLELIPVSSYYSVNNSNNSKTLFEPFYLKIRDAFSSQQIIPGKNGKYFTKENAYWASDSELSDLFKDEQISFLFENPNSGWVFTSAGKKQINQKNKDLEAYINSITKESVDAKKLLRRITPVFMEMQSDEWILSFYKYLKSHPYLWTDKDKLAIKQPLILNQDRKSVSPFNSDFTVSQIFLPTNLDSVFDTVYEAFSKDEDAMDFFKAIGLDKPDIKAEVYNHILPKYKTIDAEIDSETIKRDISKILSFYDACTVSEHKIFLDRIRELPFLISYNLLNNDILVLKKPNEIYLTDSDLQSYFGSNGSTFYLNTDFYKTFLSPDLHHIFDSLINHLLIGKVPRIFNVDLDCNTETKEAYGLDRIKVSYKYESLTQIIDVLFDGLPNSLNNIDLKRSVIIWKFLLSYASGKALSTFKDLFAGNYLYYPRSYSYLETHKFLSSTEEYLKKTAWLFNTNGEPLSPDKIDITELHTNYDTDNYSTKILVEFLGVKSIDADLDLTAEQKKAYEIGKKLLSENVSSEDLNWFLQEMAKKNRIDNEPLLLFPKEEIEVNDFDIQKIFQEINNGIKTKRKEKEFETNSKENIANSLLPLEEPTIIQKVDIPTEDFDDYSRPTISIDKKIENLTLQAEAQVEELTRIKKLQNLASESEIYSYAWFKALLELEYLGSSELNASGKPISIQFAKVDLEPGTDSILVLRSPNRYIPQNIEDIGDIQLRMYQDNKIKSVTVEVSSIKEYTLRAKIKKSSDLSEIDFDKVTRAVIDIKNPIFILEELRKSFYQLGFDDSKNMLMDLHENIRFVFGPPGTGKTTHLAAKEIIPLMNKDKDLKILVLTPTNKAADVLTKRIMENMNEDNSYLDWLFRFGSTIDTDLEGHPVVVDKSFDIRKHSRNTTITTVARFAYDYFLPDPFGDRLHLKFLDWDYIIIDEASMINLASITYVIYQKGKANIIIAGDPFQIQPISSVEQWKNENIYTMINLQDFNDPDTRPHSFDIVNLDTQYRSIPSIGRLFSEFTYGGILKHHRIADSKKDLIYNNVLLKDITIIKFPVSPWESIYKPGKLNNSNIHTYSALFTVELVLDIANQIIRHDKKSFKIGVICPYRPQAQIIEKILANKFPLNSKVEIMVGTIHGFQGDECDIIISVFNPPENISKGPDMFLNKQNILNVAISRPSDYLIILMPDDNTQKIENLWKLKKIEKIANSDSNDSVITHHSNDIEKMIFNNKYYLEENSFATTHQQVNVYSKPEKKYEVRCESSAIDIQIKV